MKTSPKRLLAGLVDPIGCGLILFLAAGTFSYWQAWMFLAVAALSAWIPGVYLMRTNPVASERRTRGGPTGETRTLQKIVIACWYSSLAGAVLVSALDHRFGWSHVPTAICLVGAVLVSVGVVVQMLVVIQNSYAAVTVQVEAGQQLASTGLYGLVRHPMYTGNVIMLVGIPLALGSYWGLVLLIPGLIVLALRIGDEEKMLHEELHGYREYTEKVRYRMLPYVW